MSFTPPHVANVPPTPPPFHRRSPFHTGSLQLEGSVGAVERPVSVPSRHRLLQLAKKQRKTKFDLIFLVSYFLPLSVSQTHTWSIGAEKQPFEEFGFKIAKV